jgi:flagellar motor switch protein FliM
VADILEQNEVDALLAAVEAGQIPPAHAEEDVAPSKRVRQVDDYDFQRPERVSKEHMRSLASLHETFSRSFGAAMSGFLRTIVEIRVSNIEQLTYGDFIQSLPNPTCFNLLSPNPLEGQMCLELSPLIIYPIIDRLLGGSTAEMFIPQRPLTAIEMRLIRRILDLALASLAEAWSNILELTFTLEETESNPQLVQIVPPNEVVVVVAFEIKMGGRVGTMGLCIPFNVIEPLAPKLSNQSWLNYRRKVSSSDSVNQVAKRVEGASVKLRAFLAHTAITVRDLAELAPGDIITTERPANSEMILQVEGKNKFAARLGQHKGKKALKITRKVAPGEQV